jgi:3-phytase
MNPMPEVSSRPRTRRFPLALIALAAAVLVGFARFGLRYEVSPLRETEPVPSRGDCADDPCIWVSPDAPSRSLVIATDKKSGLCVYDLDGRMLQHLEVGRLNNVDVRDGFPFETGVAPIVAASNKDHDSIDVFALDPATRTLRFEFRVAPPKNVYPDGLCLYRSPRDGSFHVFVATKNGALVQFRLHATGGDPERRVRFSGESEGCVADDELGVLYVSEENVGIWRLDAEPEGGDRRVLVDSVGMLGRLNNDVEGLAIWRGEQGAGFLIASNQGADDFLVYERQGENRFVGRFSIGASNAVDAVRHTDGIEVTSANLGPDLPRGLLVVQDDADDLAGDTGSTRQNFKLISWEEIERAISRPF